MKINKLGFSLIELLIAILIFGMVILGGFYALSSVNIGKIKLIEKTDINKEAFYFSEKLFEEIKAGGVIDFEEYFNRFVVGNNTLSGHFSQATGFGNYGNGGSVGTINYGNGFYFCRSGNGVSMGTGGCYNNTTFNNLGISGGPQRYGQYVFNFIDYNANQDNDLGDQDGDGNFRGDDDDEYLGEGPIVFTGGQDVKELYLISGDRKKRTLFRWNWKLDPAKNKPVGAICDGTATNFTRAGSGCLGTIQILKLVGKDLGFNHNATGSGVYDGIIDTWEVDPDFAGGVDGIVAGSGGIDSYWQDLFPDNISVKDFKVFLYPNKDRVLSFKDLTDSTNINQYARIHMILTPSRKKRGSMNGEIPEIKIATTINITDYFSK